MEIIFFTIGMLVVLWVGVYLSGVLLHFGVAFIGFKLAPNRHLAILETLVGIYGWVWIGAGVMMVVRLLQIMFSDGDWFGFFWWLTIASAFKMLCRASMQSKERIWQWRWKP